MMLEFPHSPENSLWKEFRHTQPFAPSLPDVTVRYRCLNFNGLSACVSLDAGYQDMSSLYWPILHTVSVFVKLKIWRVPNTFRSLLIVDFWLFGHQDGPMLQTATTSASDHERLFASQAQKYAIATPLLHILSSSTNTLIRRFFTHRFVKVDWYSFESYGVER